MWVWQLGKHDIENIWLVKLVQPLAESRQFPALWYFICDPCCSATLPTLKFAQALPSHFSAALWVPAYVSPAKPSSTENGSVLASKVLAEWWDLRGRNIDHKVCSTIIRFSHGLPSSFLVLVSWRQPHVCADPRAAAVPVPCSFIVSALWSSP